MNVDMGLVVGEQFWVYTTDSMPFILWELSVSHAHLYWK